VNIILLITGGGAGIGADLILVLTFVLIYLLIYFLIIKPGTVKIVEDLTEQSERIEEGTEEPGTLFEVEFGFFELIDTNMRKIFRLMMAYKRQVIVIGLLFFLLLTIRSIINFGTERNLYKTNPNVVAAADSIVSSVFKSYSNIKFLNDKLCTVKLTGKDIFTVSSYVESQNSFKDAVRNKFEITIQNTGAKWITREFLLDGKKLK